MSKLISMEAENVKRLRFVRIEFRDGVMVIGGQNGEGKTSVLDAIAMALGGNDLVPEKPIREGATRGRIKVDLGDLIVSRVFTAGGSRLEVTEAGAKVSSPQSILDRLVGKLTLDPLDFYRQKPAQQLETLKRIVGLDFSKLDSERASVYAERTAVNKEVGALRVLVESTPKHPEAPSAPVSSADIVAELNAALAQNQTNAAARRGAEDKARVAANAHALVAQAEAKIEKIRAELQAATEAHAAALAAAADASAAAAAAKVEAAQLVDIDTTAVQAKLQSLESINAQVADNVRASKLDEQVREAEGRAAKLTQRIEDIDRAKAQHLADAKFPIEGLSFDDAGVLYRGIPLVQCSAAEQLRVAVSLSFAMNPAIKLALVRDGSLLDERSMELLGRLAEEHGAQVIVERVGRTGHVVLEDGMVQEPEAGEAAASFGATPLTP